MAARNRQFLQIIGVVLVVIGVGLIVWGYQDAQGIGAEIQQRLGGSPPDQVMRMYIGGAVSLAVGLFLLFWK